MSETPFGRNLAAEIVGTVLVMLGGPGVWVLAGDRVGSVGIALCFGLSTALAIGVIGAVANPMFSVALWISRGISVRELLTDFVGQVIGSVLGGAIIYAIAGGQTATVGANGFETSAAFGMQVSGFGTLGTVIAAELVLGTLVTVILLSSISQQTSNAAMAAFTGAGVTVASMMLLPISGVGLNPARSLGSAVFSAGDPSPLAQLWPFVVVPFVAAVAGTFVWLAIDDATIDDTVFDDTVLEDLADAVTGDTDEVNAPTN